MNPGGGGGGDFIHKLCVVGSLRANGSAHSHAFDDILHCHLCHIKGNVAVWPQELKYYYR